MVRFNGCGSVGTQRVGAIRGGLALFSAALLLVNGLGWAVFGPGWGAARGAAAAERDARPAPLCIASVLPTQGLLETDRLTVVFAEPLVAASLADAPLPDLTADPFRIEPQLAGRWEWASPASVEFILDAPLKRGQAIEMTPTPALEALAGRAVAAGTRPRWEAGRLGFEAVTVRSADPSHVTLELVFDAPVDADALRAALSVTRKESGQNRGPATVPFTLLTRDAELRHAVRIERPEAPEVEVTIAAGLAPTTGPLGVDTTTARRVRIPRAFDLVDTWTYVSSTAELATVYLRFDRALDPAQETPPVTVQPAAEVFSARASGQSLVIEGAFECGQRYTFRVGETLLAADGAPLARERTISCRIPHRSISVSIPHDSGILTPGGGLCLELATTNVPSVEVRAYRVLPGNLVPLLRGERIGYTSRQVVSKSFALPLDADVPQRHVLDLAALFAGAPGVTPDGPRGVFSIEARSTTDRWQRGQALVRITDLAPTVKQDADGYHVWVQSITTGAPVVGAAVSALSVTDQLLARATTDSEGYAALPVPSDHPDGRAYVVTAEHADDLGYVEVEGAGWTVPRALTEGRVAPRVADVYVYPERSLYRPGDTVHLTGLARTPQGEVYTRPLRVVIERPDGRVALDVAAAPEMAQGFFHVDVPTTADARTGTWQVRVLAEGEDDVVGRARFGVEAFLSARLVINASAPASSQPLAPGSERSAAEGAELAPLCMASVQSLAGTSVEAFPVRAVARWTPARYESTRGPEFDFAPLEDPRAPQRFEWSGALDAEGRVGTALPGAQALAPGRWTGRIDWTVTEPGGRSVSTTQAVEHDASPLHLGLALADAVSIGAPADVRWIAVDAADRPVATPRLGWTLERIRREARLERVGGHLAWVNKESAEAVSTGLVEASAEGAGRFGVPVAVPGLYRLALRAEGGPTVARTFHAVEGDPLLFVPPLTDLEAVVLTPLVAAALPGTLLEVDVRAPFDGSLLITLEDTHLRAQRRVELVDGAARVALPLPADLRGGAFLSAQVTRPLGARAAAWLPHRAYGWTRVTTLHAAHALPITLTAPERVRPGARATISVALAGDAQREPTARPARVHLFAVDEGIRVTGGDRRPDPLRHFFAPRAHSTATRDAWGDLLPDHELPPEVQRIGGDADLGAGVARRRAPEEVHRVPGVVWREAVELDASGERAFEIEVPDFIGTLTWLAVVADGDRYGSAEALTLLAGELPLQASFPRFVAPGDRFLVPVAYENSTRAQAVVDVVLALQGPVRVVGELDEEGVAVQGQRAVEASFERSAEWKATDGDRAGLAPGARARRWFELEATGSGRVVGEVRLVGALSDGSAVHERVAVDLPVRTGRPLVVAHLVRALVAGAPTTIDLARELDLDTSDDLAPTEVSVSSSFDAGLAPLGRYVLDYPHGCAEQTSSRIWALLTLPTAAHADGDSIASLSAPSDGPDEGPDEGPGADSERARAARERVGAGLDRLWSMQVAGGGVGYWPGSDRPSPWASLYVAEVALACADAGHAVPRGLMTGLASYLERELPDLEDAATQALCVRLLTGLGRPQPGWSKRLAERAGEDGRAGNASDDSRGDTRADSVSPAVALGRAGRIELAYAAALTQRRDDALRFLRPAATIEAASGGPSQGGFQRLHTPVRTLALELRTWLLLDPTDPEVPRLATALNAARTRGRFGNTVDNAAALAALARFRDTFEGTPADWSGTLTTAAGARAVSAGDALTLSVDAAVPVTFASEGRGTAWLVAKAEGRRAAGAPASDRGLVVRRRWLDADGEPIDLDHVPLGALIEVELTLATDGRGAVEDIAIVDALPGGFEVENARLANTSAAAAARSSDRNALAPERIELLDDRVLVFASAGPDTRALRYHVRAVALGSFEHAPVQAEAMYSPEVASVGGATERVTVVR